MATRVRLAGVVLQLEAYVDDGENLEPLQLQPIRTSVSEFKNLDLAEITKTIQTQYDEQHPEGEDPLDAGFQ
jgi:hypothetical protein